MLGPGPMHESLHLGPASREPLTHPGQCPDQEGPRGLTGLLYLSGPGASTGLH